MKSYQIYQTYWNHQFLNSFQIHIFALLISMILPEKYNEKLRFMFHSFFILHIQKEDINGILL